MKIIPWPIKKADQIFSELIRIRDTKCVLCSKPSTDCSHFYERAKSSVRFHPLNCDGVCRQCHQFWHANRKEYKIFKLNQIGEKDYMALQRLSTIIMKQDIAITNFMKTYDILGRI